MGYGKVELEDRIIWCLRSEVGTLYKRMGNGEGGTSALLTSLNRRDE